MIRALLEELPRPRNGKPGMAEPDYAGWLTIRCRAHVFASGLVNRHTHDFYRVSDFALSWNNSNFSVPSARGWKKRFTQTIWRLSQESVYLTYVTDAGDGSQGFLNMSYSLSSISPETRFRSAMTQYEPAYVYRDEKTFVLEEYMLWELVLGFTLRWWRYLVCHAAFLPAREPLALRGVSSVFSSKKWISKR